MLCVSCDKTALCIHPGKNGRNCFAIFHSSVFDQFKNYYEEKRKICVKIYKSSTQNNEN